MRCKSFQYHICIDVIIKRALCLRVKTRSSHSQGEIQLALLTSVYRAFSHNVKKYYWRFTHIYYSIFIIWGFMLEERREGFFWAQIGSNTYFVHCAMCSSYTPLIIAIKSLVIKQGIFNAFVFLKSSDIFSTFICQIIERNIKLHFSRQSEFEKSSIDGTCRRENYHFDEQRDRITPVLRLVSCCYSILNEYRVTTWHIHIFSTSNVHPISSHSPIVCLISVPNDAWYCSLSLVRFPAYLSVHWKTVQFMNLLNSAAR